LRWEVADANAWWAMRARSGGPDVAAFWKEVDSFCLSRERVYLTPQRSSELCSIADSSGGAFVNHRYRETAQLALRNEIEAEQLDELQHILISASQSLPGLLTSALARNLAPEYAAGHLTWDVLFPDRSTAIQAKNSSVWMEAIEPALEQYCGEVHALELETIGAGLRDSALANGIKRTAFFRQLPNVQKETASRFEQDLLEMPLQIPEIRNWRLSRAHRASWDRTSCAPWTYVWEQEFIDLERLTGPYMSHPHHWSHIDRWFDTESGIQAIDAGLSHAFSPLGQSLLARELISEEGS